MRRYNLQLVTSISQSCPLDVLALRSLVTVFVNFISHMAIFSVRESDKNLSRNNGNHMLNVNNMI